MHMVLLLGHEHAANIEALSIKYDRLVHYRNISNITDLGRNTLDV